MSPSSSPSPTTFQGVNGSGYLIDLQLTAFDASFNALLSSSSGYFPTFNGGLNKSVDRVGFQTGVPGFVCLFSTTPTSINPAGPLTNLAGIFNIDAVATLPNGATQITTSWLVGGAFANNEAVTMTTFVLNGTAPTVLPADFATMPGLLSDVVVTPFHVTGAISPTANTSVFVPGQPANASALQVVVFTPQPGETLGVNGFNFVIDLLAIASDERFNPLLTADAGYVPLNANGTNPAITRPGPSVAAPGFVCLLNTTKAGATTNLAGLFQLIGVFSDPGDTTNQLLNGVWPMWQVGAANFGTGASRLTVFFLNTTAPAQVDVTDATVMAGLISAITTVDFFISAPAVTIAPPAPIQAAITFPLATTTQGVNGSGWVVDLVFTSTAVANNAQLLPPFFTAAFENGLNTSVTHAGASTPVPGLVVLLSTTSNNSRTLFGPGQNLAGLFQEFSPFTSAAGLQSFRTLWQVGAPAFGVGVTSTLTAFIVSGTAPALVDPTAPTAGLTLLSTVASVVFNISGTVSQTAATSTFPGPTPANASAVNVKVFTPAPGDTIGVDATDFVIDLRAITTAVGFNPLLSAGAGYVPLFDNGTNPAISHTGPNVAAPGLVVLLSTTAAGANVNLAGLFQINAINTATSPAGALNEVWNSWLATKAAFGTGPSTLTVFFVNGTAPATVVGSPQSQTGLISNVVTVDFFIASSASTGGGSVKGDPWFSGFHSQAPYQVHGVPGAVFNILTAPTLQLNALFAFYGHGDVMTAAQMEAARLASPNAQLPTTQPWSHPGTYLGKLGLKVGGLQLLLEAGDYTSGIAGVAVVADGQRSEVEVGQRVGGRAGSVQRVDAWRLRVVHPLVSFVLVNSDRFFNVEEAALRSSQAHQQMDGLLGQSANPQWKADKGRLFEQHMMFDYLVVKDDGDQAQDALLLSDAFDNNRFA